MRETDFNDIYIEDSQKEVFDSHRFILEGTISVCKNILTQSYQVSPLFKKTNTIFPSNSYLPLVACNLERKSIIEF